MYLHYQYLRLISLIKYSPSHRLISVLYFFDLVKNKYFYLIQMLDHYVNGIRYYDYSLELVRLIALFT